AVAIVKNMQPFLRPGFQARKLAEQELIGIVTNSTKNLVAPFGGFEPILGTNPLGFAIPFRGGVIVADFATSKKANGEVKMAKLKNSELPDEVFFDSNGEYTTDPDAVYSIDVFGDYKGLAISLLIEVLTGALLGAEVGEKDGKSRNAMFLAIDPSKFGDYDDFLDKNAKLVERVKNSKTREGMEVYYPGERSQRIREENLGKGYFELSDEVVRALEDIEVQI
ncbi:hypothetical protein GF389_05945, partial [Candidatus Dojkabacteria bacterium]|nr:hypothetical protein [Candidatus Dojkabacteria bacterium]